ncbi:sentrin-specific protease 7 isoform X1 [Hippoglossus hippoglossus]|uniref:sentrin-specific protease 7 isoform X1 n=1 Tax=Hippoglossus hippoglossus TaxID=8267 RepID=UPI00148E6462|nr:sentrin-specific protease 7 isoform X1 [Hippoglossus hippoglossus]
MMDRRRALSIPFSVEKDNMMESPLKISTICLSSECGELDRQVSWTAFAGSKLRHPDSEHKNGSRLLDDNTATMVTLQMATRKPCLVLTDVLKTDLGKTYMEKIKPSHTPGNGGQMSSTWKERDRCKEDPGVCRELRSIHGEAKQDKRNGIFCKRNQTPNSPSQRSRLRRKSQNMDYKEDRDENKDIKEMIIGKSNGESYKYAEVVDVDCGLSVSWEPAENTRDCDEFSPKIIKEKSAEPEKEVQQSVKKKRNNSGSLHNSTVSPKRRRESVLRLTGEDGRDRVPARPEACVAESGEEGDSENVDRTIVQFTVGGDDGREVLVPIITPYLETGDAINTQRDRESSQDSTTKTSSPSDPIVLSSDDEESDNVPPHCRPPVHTLVTMEDTVIQKAVIRQDDCDLQDMQVLRAVVDKLPVSVARYPIPSIDHSCMSIAFSTLHCGGYRGIANGNIMMADQTIIIPLKDSTDQVELMLTFERTALRRYSVWEEQEMEMRELHFNGDENPFPAAVLVFCVSDTAAAEIQHILSMLCVEQDGNTNTGTASPFILLTLRDPLEGMEGALLRSLLDIDCLNSLTHEQSLGSLGSDRFRGWDEIQNPVLCLDDSIELIRKIGLDSHLLCLLGLESPDPEPNAYSSHSDTEENNMLQICPEVELQKGTPPDPETTSEEDTGTEVKPEEDQKEEDEHPSEKKKEGPTPVYTLCHRRTKGSYSVSHCKPDSSWIKYKHRGLPSRLIQFPPPPLKGGITVTMEDLQCLDSGQFLNDVIIDFYLKYLLHNASDAVAERSHIFSSFFYKQLTRRDNASEGATSDTCQRQRRHQRVKTWTRHVDIFKKDFLFVPVNQEAHWYLVVICFHGLNEPKFEAWPGPGSEMTKSHDETEKLQEQDEAQSSKCPNDTETAPQENPSDNVAPETENTKEQLPKDPPPGPVRCTEKTFQKRVVCKRPCILIMDSLKPSLHERVFKLLREYLQSEWEVRRGSTREFSPDQMKGSHCQVPRQDNSSDCGLYLLQYVESFLKDPVVHFDLPLRLERWFPRQQVRRKRDEIRDLVLNLYRWQNLDSDGHE